MPTRPPAPAQRSAPGSVASRVQSSAGVGRGKKVTRRAGNGHGCRGRVCACWPAQHQPPARTIRPWLLWCTSPRRGATAGSRAAGQLPAAAAHASQATLQQAREREPGRDESVVGAERSSRPCGNGTTRAGFAAGVNLSAGAPTGSSPPASRVVIAARGDWNRDTDSAEQTPSLNQCSAWDLATAPVPVPVPEPVRARPGVGWCLCLPWPAVLVAPALDTPTSTLHSRPSHAPPRRRRRRRRRRHHARRDAILGRLPHPGATRIEHDPPNSPHTRPASDPRGVHSLIPAALPSSASSAQSSNQPQRRKPPALGQWHASCPHSASCPPYSNMSSNWSAAHPPSPSL